MEKKNKPVKQRGPKLDFSDLSDREDRIEELLDFAQDFALKWIETMHGSARDFVLAMEREFGLRIRMYLSDIVYSLLTTKELSWALRQYLDATLGFEQLAEALGVKPGCHDEEYSSLDGLFQRSICLQSSSKYAEAINFVSRIRRYSPYNNLLVYIQNPLATFWATEARWEKDFKRYVKNDARPLLILAPMTPVMLVYDVMDTEGEPLPEWFTEHFIVEGDFDETVLGQTISNCIRHDAIEVVKKELSMTHGGSAIRLLPLMGKKMKIKLKQGLDAKSQYAILCHELAHIYLGHLGSDNDRWWPARISLDRNQMEIEAESVAYIVSRRSGLSTHSAEYITSYLKEPNDFSMVSIDLVVKVAGRIERMGERNLPERTPKSQNE